MKRLSSRHLPRLVTEIQVTPLLDLMLLLLLTVIVLLPVLPGESKPAVAAEKLVAAKIEPVTTVELNVAADLKLTLAGKGIEHRELIADLKQRVTAEPELGVILRIPASLPAPRLLELMDALRAATVKHTAITTIQAASP